MATKTISPTLEILKDHTHGFQRFQDWLNYQLHQQVVTVTFIKVDGTERVMRCTLKDDIVPKQEWDKITENRKKPPKPKKISESTSSTDLLNIDSLLDVTPKNQTTRSVYDVDSQSWRSFRWDSIKLVEYDDKDTIESLFSTQ